MPMLSSETQVRLGSFLSGFYFDVVHWAGFSEAWLVSSPYFPQEAQGRATEVGGSCSLDSLAHLDRWAFTTLDFLEEYDIRTQVCAVIEHRHRTSEPEPCSRQQLLQCKSWATLLSPGVDVHVMLQKQGYHLSAGFRFLQLQVYPQMVHLNFK